MAYLNWLKCMFIFWVESGISQCGNLCASLWCCTTVMRRSVAVVTACSHLLWLCAHTAANHRVMPILMSAVTGPIQLPAKHIDIREITKLIM